MYANAEFKSGHNNVETVATVSAQPTQSVAKLKSIVYKKTNTHNKLEKYIDDLKVLYELKLYKKNDIKVNERRRKSNAKLKISGGENNFKSNSLPTFGINNNNNNRKKSTQLNNLKKKHKQKSFLIDHDNDINNDNNSFKSNTLNSFKNSCEQGMRLYCL